MLSQNGSTWLKTQFCHSYLNNWFQIRFLFLHIAPPEWPRGKRVRLMTWWLWVRPRLRRLFFPAYFRLSSLQKHVEKSSRWLWKEKLCKYWCEKARKHICVTDCHDMTLAVKVALNSNTINQLYAYHEPENYLVLFIEWYFFAVMDNISVISWLWPI